jgi:translation initiation factor 3 subunit B
MNTAEHFMCTDIEWDPTGRFVASSVGHIHQMENGFIMWLFNGTELYSQKRERFLQFSWRPRPESLLTGEQVEQINKEFKKYSKKYQEEDELIHTQADADVLEARKRLQEKWNEWRESRKEYAEQLAKGRREILEKYYTLEDEEFTVQEVETETQISYTEETVKK